MKEITNIRTDAIQSPLNLAVAQSNRAAASKCEDCSAQEDEHMSDGLDVIVLDDDPGIGEILSELIESFYTWGEVHCFTELNKAISFCLTRDIGVAIFVVDVFLGGLSGFSFLDAIDEKYPTAHEDAIIISGNANEDVVNMCLASNVNYLLEKPVKPYALQLAVRAITAKYLDFAKKLIQNPDFAESVARL